MTTQNLNSISSGNGLFSEGNKPLPESILFNFQWGHVAFTSVHFRGEFSRYLSWYEFENYLFKITAASPRGPWVDMERVVMSCCHDVHWYGWSSDLLCCRNLQMSLLIGAQQSYIPLVVPPSLSHLTLINPHTWRRYYIGLTSLKARFMGPTWGPSGADRTQVGPMFAPWILLSGTVFCHDSTLATDIMIHAYAVNPIKYEYGFVLLCLDAITLSVIIGFIYWI